MHPKTPRAAISLLCRSYILDTPICNPSLSSFFPQSFHLNSVPPSPPKELFRHDRLLFTSICGHGVRCGHLQLRLLPIDLLSSKVNAFRFSGASSQTFRREPGMRRYPARPNFMSPLRSSSVACDTVPKPEKLKGIVEVVSRAGVDMELNLNEMNLTLCTSTVNYVLRALSDHGILALRFLQWVSSSRPGFNPSSEVCNLILDNLGRLGEYNAMYSMLTELSLKGHCLTEKSFTFLKICSNSSIKDSVRRVTEVLISVRGSCRGSGIFSLIKVLCSLNSFELALYVLELAIRKTSYYNVLIAAKCGNGDFIEAVDFLAEIKDHGCIPNTKSYNYLLGSLFKNNRIAEACMLLQKAEEAGCIPDLITYEVIVVHACKANLMNNAIEVLNHMLSKGLKPRLTTHAEFIKSLLVGLFQKSGRMVEAGRILYEMMEKGYKPNFPVFIKVLKALHNIGRGDLSSELKSMFSIFSRKIDAG
ncbi:hypothetical protein HPP92_008463 [Vanilla planifolia]|uniref:Pentatricopeptide repeat-containing protein n=1 Tax=Vanilla planifolia TaxID=51239 RepID=A0A835R4R8_VANPL|nr:hypothetical protein HPP92_008463 [Vanilla planifolia]